MRCPLREGDEVHAHPLHQQPPDRIEVPVIVAFAEPGIIQCKPVVETLGKMAELSERLIQRFAPFL